MQCLEKCVRFAERRYKMKGYFCVCENPNEKFDISFQVRESVEDDIPEEQQELYLNAEKTCNIIKSLENTDENTKKKYFDKLLSLSQVGLVPEYAQTKASKLALEKLQEEIVLIEGKRIKNGYMKTLAIDALILAVHPGWPPESVPAPPRRRTLPRRDGLHPRPGLFRAVLPLLVLLLVLLLLLLVPQAVVIHQNRRCSWASSYSPRSRRNKYR